jgi:hypothetical protein
MKKTLLLCGVMLAVAPLFAQVYEGHPPIDIQVNPGNPQQIGLFVQGTTGGAGIVGIEGNATGTIFGMAATVTNGMILGTVNPNNTTGFSAINIDYQNHVGINTLNTSGFLFNCAGSAVFDQVTVKNFSGNNPKATPWADFVFDKTYRLLPLDSLSVFIKTNSHLPGIPTAEEVQKNGIDLGATQAKLLEKIEQLTLYTIDLQKQTDDLRKEVELLKEANQKKHSSR